MGAIGILNTKYEVWLVLYVTPKFSNGGNGIFLPSASGKRPKISSVVVYMLMVWKFELNWRPTTQVPVFKWFTLYVCVFYDAFFFTRLQKYHGTCYIMFDKNVKAIEIKQSI